MTSTKQKSIGARLLASLGGILAAGCAANAPYHTTIAPASICATNPDDDACVDSVYQEFAAHDIAFAEFSERGNAFDDNAIASVLAKIGQHADTNGVIVVVFVHGWKHNAAEKDSNVLSFKAAMRDLSSILAETFAGTSLAQRRLVGLYVGWRGASIQLPGLQQLTFWDRKAVAEELGSGSITRLLLDLDRITATQGRNALVVIGHSFGGAIVMRAVTEVMTDRVLHPMPDGRARTLGNGVLVLNPALEANQALPFVEAALQQRYIPAQLPLLISLSSDADQATHYAFPAGQSIGLLTWRQAELQRSHYHDRRTPEQNMPLREHHLDATTAGNFAPFLTHRLSTSGDGDNPQFTLSSCTDVPGQCVPMGWTSLRGQPTLGPLPDNYPLYFIKTDRTVMGDHNDIFNAQVRSFVFTVIDDVIRLALHADAKAVMPTDAAPLLASPARFGARMNLLWQRMQKESR